jgi:hypothetical protein
MQNSNHMKVSKFNSQRAATNVGGPRIVSLRQAASLIESACTDETKVFLGRRNYDVQVLALYYK